VKRRAAERSFAWPWIHSLYRSPPPPFGGVNKIKHIVIRARLTPLSLSTDARVVGIAANILDAVDREFNRILLHLGINRFSCPGSYKRLRGKKRSRPIHRGFLWFENHMDLDRRLGRADDNSGQKLDSSSFIRAKGWRLTRGDEMAAVEVTITGMLYDKTMRTSRPVVLIGEASLTGLGVGGGPMPGGGAPVDPGYGYPEKPVDPGYGIPEGARPSHPIYYPGARPEHPIVIPEPPTEPPQPPSEPKPPPPDGGWGWHPEYGWGYFPMQGGKPQPVP
jgi:hypothetical protein